MKQQFINWWASLQQREQRLVLAAAIAVLVGVFYWGLWQPLHQNKALNQQKVEAAKTQLNQLQQAIPKLKGSNAVVSKSGGSLSQVISDSAKQSGVAVSRMQAQNEQLTLVLEDVAFETLLAWLHALQYQHGIKLTSLDISTAEKPGIVRVRRMVVE